MTVSVLIVDDQAMVRAGFAAILDAQPDIEVVGQAADGEEGVALAQRLRPDVVLMDVRMPGTNGLEATRRLMDPPPRVDHRPRVVILTTFDIDEYVHDALAAGASGFLLKDAPPADLVQAVRVVASGDALLAPSVTRRLLERFAEQRPPSDRHALRLAGLTEREREILERIARGRSNTEIAAELFIAEQTVKTHVTRIFAKLGLRDRVQAVILAYDAGLVQPDR
ncbi:DNA-binding response regulator [Leucobacter sp. OLJS4]|uniref:response regulator n=1 Tax=unclassified Leucobacter TaxID=2621730 RepID=UPI000C19BA36|nr:MULTISPECIES: response regulator transcription factor [unclassified Leucobacter]PII87886.1 DNA-binding response regulator [Leucobacter sp. OLCALW19]PII92870.1 DNA-binding response regulator [Leucobacter sp. OLAS13]PII96347.1 DNA-binding response regulator [Leucobacter sp. OLTLW20]PII97591.1 DNA-binding response regulator [Leucobacter sp. OLCS4]PII99118.1 DNA-binding response regulator [Leucobacter sp. OLDS2]